MNGDYQYHVDGCEQLLGYCTGRERRAFALDFFKIGGMYEKLLDQREQMDEKTPLVQNAPSINHGIKGAFLTSHTHASGAFVELLHAGCSVPETTAKSAPERRKRLKAPGVMP